MLVSAWLPWQESAALGCSVVSSRSRELDKESLAGAPELSPKDNIIPSFSVILSIIVDARSTLRLAVQHGLYRHSCLRLRGLRHGCRPCPHCSDALRTPALLHSIEATLRPSARSASSGNMPPKHGLKPTPRGGKAAVTSNGGRGNGNPSQQPPEKPKRAQVLVACSYCRRKKLKVRGASQAS